MAATNHRVTLTIEVTVPDIGTSSSSVNALAMQKALALLEGYAEPEVRRFGQEYIKTEGGANAASGAARATIPLSSISVNIERFV